MNNPEITEEMTEKALWVKDLEEYLNIGHQKALNLMRSAGFPSIRLGRRYFVMRSDLEDWIRKYRYRTYEL